MFGERQNPSATADPPPSVPRPLPSRPGLRRGRLGHDAPPGVGAHRRERRAGRRERGASHPAVALHVGWPSRPSQGLGQSFRGHPKARMSGSSMLGKCWCAQHVVDIHLFVAVQKIGNQGNMLNSIGNSRNSKEICEILRTSREISTNWKEL